MTRSSVQSLLKSGKLRRKLVTTVAEQVSTSHHCPSSFL
jgi:hypothetical protein